MLKTIHEFIIKYLINNKSIKVHIASKLIQVHIIGYGTKPDPYMHNVTEQHALVDMKYG
jgi:hypothetical protein